MRSLITAVLTGAALSAAALPVAASTLSGDELRKRITGKRVYLATPLGGELPLFFRPDGVVNGSGEAIGLGRFFAPRDSGRWFIQGNRLCQQFEKWYNGERLCFTVTDLGNNRIRWVRDNGEQGIARLGN